MSTRVFLCALRVMAIGAFCTLNALAQIQWTELSPTGVPPSPRSQSAAVFDPVTQQMIVFGGGYPPDLNDTWSLNLSGSPLWTELAPVGTPPAPRELAAGVYDAANSRMMIFGGGEGSTSPCQNDVWVLSNANGVNGVPSWSQLSPTGPPPSPRYASAVYDPNSNTMIIFGGSDCFSTYYNDVWTLSNANGLGGTPAWTELSPAGSAPAPRDFASAVYDPNSNTMAFFGGNEGATNFNDVWTLSNANGQGGTPTWTQLNPSGTAPSARLYQSAVYDPNSNMMTIFGGSDDTGPTNDVWQLSNANGKGGTPVWTEILPSGTLISPRAAQSAVLDSTSGSMVVFGGSSQTSELNDTWLLSGLEKSYSICLLYDPTRSVHSGATIPLKFYLCDASGNDVSASTIVVHAVGLTQTSTTASEVIQDAGDSNPDNDFRFDSTLGPSGGYIFNLKTAGLTTGSYQLTFTSGTGTAAQGLTFQVR